MTTGSATCNKPGMGAPTRGRGDAPLTFNKDEENAKLNGQEGISNSYLVDAGGNVNMPLIGTVPARGTTPQQLAQIITTRLKQGFVREPHRAMLIVGTEPADLVARIRAYEPPRVIKWVKAEER